MKKAVILWNQMKQMKVDVEMVNKDGEKSNDDTKVELEKVKLEHTEDSWQCKKELRQFNDDEWKAFLLIPHSHCIGTMMNWNEEQVGCELAVQDDPLESKVY